MVGIREEVPNHLPVEIRRDRTHQVNVLDQCGLTCTFCHNQARQRRR
jgi:hypothetical protein